MGGRGQRVSRRRCANAVQRVQEERRAGRKGGQGWSKEWGMRMVGVAAAWAAVGGRGQPWAAVGRG